MEISALSGFLCFVVSQKAYKMYIFGVFWYFLLKNGGFLRFLAWLFCKLIKNFNFLTVFICFLYVFCNFFMKVLRLCLFWCCVLYSLFFTFKKVFFVMILLYLFICFCILLFACGCFFCVFPGRVFSAFLINIFDFICFIVYICICYEAWSVFGFDETLSYARKSGGCY